MVTWRLQTTMQVTGSNSNQYILSIRFSADGFYFALSNPKVKEESDSSTPYIYKVDESLSITANLKQAIDKLEWLSYRYKAVNIVITTQRFTIVPLDFFEDEHAESIFYHNFQSIDNEVVEYNIIQKNNAVVLYGIDKALLTMIYNLFPEAQVKVQATSLIEHLTLQNYHKSQQQMLCLVAKDSIILAAMNHHNLLLCNSFSCSHTSDRLYYILHCWKQLGMDQQNDELLLAAHLEETDALKQELERYVSHITAITPHFDLEAAIS